MNHFTHKPEILLAGIRHRPKLTHKGKVKYISRIQSYTVYIKFTYPKSYHTHHILSDCRILMIKIYKSTVPVPAVIIQSVIIIIVPIKMQIFKPVLVCTVFSFLFYILKCKELSTYMIEYTVYYNFYIIFMTGIYKGL